MKGAAVTVEPASRSDLETIPARLSAEVAADEQNFNGNRNLIARGQEEGQLFVLRGAGEVVAFALDMPERVEALAPGSL